MRRHALELRRERRRKDKGEDALFDVSADMFVAEDIEVAKMYRPEPPRPPYRLR